MLETPFNEVSVGVLWHAVQLPLRSLLNNARPFIGVLSAKTKVAHADMATKPKMTLIAGIKHFRRALTMREESSLDQPNRATWLAMKVALPYAARV